MWLLGVTFTVRPLSPASHSGVTRTVTFGPSLCGQRRYPQVIHRALHKVVRRAVVIHRDYLCLVTHPERIDWMSSVTWS